jgi:hypothetical protein
LSVLLACLPEDIVEATIERLIAQGDEVRVIEPDRRLADRYRAMGAFVAAGSPFDEDLVERAAQNVRTVVMGDKDLITEDLVGLTQGGLKAGVERWIYWSKAGATWSDWFRGEVGEGDYVVLTTGRRRFLNTRRVSPEAVAEAIDAADDLQGPVRLELDLADPSSRKALKLES